MSSNLPQKKNAEKLASDRRQEEVVRLYLTGLSMRGVARELDIHATTVLRDLERARKKWRAETAKTYDELLPEKLAQLDAIRVAAWEGWKRSLEDATAKEVTNDDGKMTTKTKQAGQAGDPRFLNQLEKCLRLECQLRGMLDGENESNNQTINIQTMEVIVSNREEKAEFDKIYSIDQFREIQSKSG